MSTKDNTKKESIEAKNDQVIDDLKGKKESVEPKKEKTTSGSSQNTSEKKSSQTETKKKTSPKEQVESEQSQNTSEEKTEKKSVAQFDRTEIGALESKKVCEISTADLLKIAVRRGEIELNPIIAKSVLNTLKKINGESFRRKQNTENSDKPVQWNNNGNNRGRFMNGNGNNGYYRNRFNNQNGEREMMNQGGYHGQFNQGNNYNRGYKKPYYKKNYNGDNNFKGKKQMRDDEVEDQENEDYDSNQE